MWEHNPLQGLRGGVGSLRWRPHPELGSSSKGLWGHGQTLSRLSKNHFPKGVKMSSSSTTHRQGKGQQHGAPGIIHMAAITAATFSSKFSTTSFNEGGHRAAMSSSAKDCAQGSSIFQRWGTERPPRPSSFPSGLGALLENTIPGPQSPEIPMVWGGTRASESLFLAPTVSWQSGWAGNV